MNQAHFQDIRPGQYFKRSEGQTIFYLHSSGSIVVACDHGDSITGTPEKNEIVTVISTFEWESHKIVFHS